MKRREALRAMGAAGALAMAPLAKDSLAATMPHKSGIDKIVLGDGHFLSKTNPIANLDTRDLEALALEVLKMPVVQRAKANAEHRFRIMAADHNVPKEAWRDWEEQINEWAYHYVILALNSDPNHPKVLMSGYGPPHEWFGMKLPGCRGPGTAENVDNNYGFIPVDGISRFRLHGQRFDNGVADYPIHVTGNLSQSSNVSALDTRDIRINADGSFVITLDPEPANGRPNHLQTSLDSRYIFIRDGRVEWNQTPNAYRIERLDPPAHPPRSIEQMAAMAARFIIDDVPMNYWFKQMIGFLKPNSLSDIAVSVDVGGMPSQKLLRGRVKIEDDEAFVLHLTPGDAKYWVLILYDWWGMSGNYWSRTSSLNNTQSEANADGSYTYVFSIGDPGVHNWIDTLGLHETLFMNRWRLLPQTPSGPGGEPTAKCELVKLADLDKALPAGTMRVNAEQRRQQVTQRLAAFQRRYTL